LGGEVVDHAHEAEAGDGDLNGHMAGPTWGMGFVRDRRGSSLRRV
jgi:hypothetical protein